MPRRRDDGRSESRYAYRTIQGGGNDMRKLSKLALGALFAGALAIPASAEDGVTETEIVLGSHTALSGPVSAWGIGSTEGMRMRFEEANEKGINGRKIKFIV